MVISEARTVGYPRDFVFWQSRAPEGLSHMGNGTEADKTGRMLRLNLVVRCSPCFALLTQLYVAKLYIVATACQTPKITRTTADLECKPSIAAADRRLMAEVRSLGEPNRLRGCRSIAHERDTDRPPSFAQPSIRSLSSGSFEQAHPSQARRPAI
jgi:hypothetical protein